jgi:hypothetical protein
MVRLGSRRICSLISGDQPAKALGLTLPPIPLASAGARAKLCTTLVRFRLTCRPTIFAGRHLALD